MRRIIAALAAASALLLTGCGGSSLEEDDPRGFAACSTLEESIATENPRVAMEHMFDAGRLARDAETPAIFEAVEEMGEIAPELAEFTLPDMDAMVAACNEHGFDLELPDS